jgi:phage terminase large subunit-like protein
MTSLRNYLSSRAYQSLQTELAATRAQRLIRHASVARQKLPDPVEWIEQHFYIPETGEPLKLVPYQAAVLREALREDENGFVYSLVLWSDIKKSAKSTIAAAVCLFLAWHTPWEAVRVVANDLKQADSRTFFYIKRALELHPEFRQQCHIVEHEIELPNHSIIQAVPVDPKGEAGGGDLMVCFTELWAYKNAASQRLWSETTLSPLKFGKSMRWCESYAGFKGDSPILENLYASGVEGGALLDVGVDGLELYVNPQARMLALWNTQPRCPWQTEDYYAQEAATLTASEFARMHRNQWASALNAFVQGEWWDGCQGALPPLGNKPIIVAMDAAVSGDCFAMVAVSRTGDKPEVRYVGVWYPPKGGTIDFSGPEGELRRLCREHNVLEVAYDPFQLHDMATRLHKAGVAFFKPFNQGQDRLIADKQLYDIIVNRRMVHQGEPLLREHLTNAGSKVEGENKLRIVKRAETSKIDAAVALSMAVDRALYYNIG